MKATGEPRRPTPEDRARFEDRFRRENGGYGSTSSGLYSPPGRALSTAEDSSRLEMSAPWSVLEFGEDYLLVLERDGFDVEMVRL